MAVIIDFNSYRTKREQQKKQEHKAENGQELKLSKEQEEVVRRKLKKAYDRWYKPHQEKYPLLAEALAVYEEAGFMNIGEQRYKFSEFVKNAKLGEFSEGCQKTGYRCNFAFKCGGEWYYVLISITGFNYDKWTFANVNNLNLVNIDFRNFVRKLRMGDLDMHSVSNRKQFYFHVYEIIGKNNQETALLKKSRSTAEMQ